MKPAAVLISTARGGLVDEAALAAGCLAGACLTFLEEASMEPLHVTVVGPPGPAAARLMREAHRFAHPFKIVERHDPASSAARKLAVPFPRMDGPAAFVCASGGCSAPIVDPWKLAPRLAKLSKRQAPVSRPR